MNVEDKIIFLWQTLSSFIYVIQTPIILRFSKVLLEIFVIVSEFILNVHLLI